MQSRGLRIPCIGGGEESCAVLTFLLDQSGYEVNFAHLKEDA
ncbi:MAG TPA: hypothetical protein VGO91_06640 [Pyrinomonadaceae bacterium]|jgi:hypothetical protein|nr:hypothetical protein [Pyrinomonadaceae bacterium]